MIYQLLQMLCTYYQCFNICSYQFVLIVIRKNSVKTLWCIDNLLINIGGHWQPIPSNTLGNFILTIPRIHFRPSSLPTTTNLTRKKYHKGPITCPLGYIMNYTDKLKQLLGKSHKIRKVKFYTFFHKKTN